MSLNEYIVLLTALIPTVLIYIDWPVPRVNYRGHVAGLANDD